MNIINVTNQLQPKEPLIPLNIEKVRFIVPHHTESSFNYTWQQCNQDHKNNGWSCGGYNEMIYANGDVYIIRGDHIGAQCQGFNSCSYGIALIGNYEVMTEVPRKQYESLLERIRFHLDRFPQNCVVVPHRELVPTACPGKHFPMAKLLSDIQPQIDTSFNNVLKVLLDNGIITTSEYWQKCQKPDALLRAEYVKIVLERMANKLYELQGGM